MNYKLNEYGIKYNELRARWMGNVVNLSPFHYANSSPRAAMNASHLTQALVLDYPTTRGIMTGTENDNGKYTFNVKFEKDVQILDVIEKYPVNRMVKSFNYNTEVVVIYEELETKKIGVLNIPRYHLKHQSFGFIYKGKQAQNHLSPGNIIPAGTILADSPNVLDDGYYCLGREMNVAFMSIPQTIEDGVVLSKSAAEALSTTGIEKRNASFGYDWYPLNLYGDENNYKIFPDIGEKVRSDGILMGFRKYNKFLDAVNMSDEALMVPDNHFDKLIYARPGDEVIDVDILHDFIKNFSPLPEGMEKQLERYFNAKVSMNERIIKTYRRLQKTQGDGLRLKPKAHNLIVNAFATSKKLAEEKVQLNYRREPLDEWRIEITLARKIIPTDGFKLTNWHG